MKPQTSTFPSQILSMSVAARLANIELALAYERAACAMRNLKRALKGKKHKTIKRK